MVPGHFNAMMPASPIVFGHTSPGPFPNESLRKSRTLVPAVVPSFVSVSGFKLPTSGPCVGPLSESRCPKSSFTIPLTDLKSIVECCTKPDSHSIIIDLRTFSEFCECRLCGSINVSVPATLLKRPRFNVSKILQTAFDPRGSSHPLDDWQHLEHVYLCVASWTASNIALAESLGKKFKNESFSGSVSIFDGGFACIRSHYSALIDDTKLEPTAVRPVLSPANSPVGSFCEPKNAATSTTPSSAAADASSKRRRSADVPCCISLQGLTARPSGFFCPLPRSELASNPFGANLATSPSLLTQSGEMTDVACSSLYRKFHSLHRLESERFVYSADKGSEWCTVDAMKPAAYSKNRYSDIVPYNVTRVHLPDSSDSDDYINASHIKTRKNEYIACQAPVSSTLNDFWLMVWDNVGTSGTIVMLAGLCEGGREMSAPYWPSKQLSEPIRTERFVIRSKSVTEVPEACCTLHVLILRDVETQSEKTINHVQYHAWSDCCSPEDISSVLRCLKLVNDLPKNGPLIVHCSAGVGRTGTFIVLDSLLRCSTIELQSSCSQSSSSDLVFELINNIRMQRMKMVQTFAQFKFVYDVVERLCQDDSLEFAFLS
ncbi:tyrosine phosphatase Pyp1 [Schizosaccharomyces japonicus yFS275]|uniref:Tyrosine phosphatase Pyp1 n=1 Tax=Schizosaccharomyces japonicus (strain yFS275 / FY16936) TaxID=402676 RepID=B6JZH3_SCHJY|nr:tyrosine phosphatase Pyp1 [Schizosaccharomyces japonicus yFS275]EEB06941.2 tyrosine phosphatase Pyp1 [Schizosaccharomyces japonicus yFS275]